MFSKIASMTSQSSYGSCATTLAGIVGASAGLAPTTDAPAEPANDPMMWARATQESEAGPTRNNGLGSSLPGQSWAGRRHPNASWLSKD